MMKRHEHRDYRCPNELFEDMPKSTTMVEASRLKIVREAFATENANALKDKQKAIYDEIVTHEERWHQAYDKNEEDGATK